MNRTKIEWCDYTWNPITGCKHGCPYCYAKKIADRFNGSKSWPNGFEPTFHYGRLNDPTKIKKPQTIFVCSMADLFGAWVPDLWVSLVLGACWQAPQHTYIFLTKNPQRYLRIRGFLGKKNLWFGATITNQNDADQRIQWLQKMPEGNRFISFEPLLGKIEHLNLRGIGQVIIGAQTNPFKEPDHFWISEIIASADAGGAKVFCKDSLSRIPETDFRRELVWE